MNVAFALGAIRKTMDERIFRLVNGSLARPVLDDVMVFLSSFRAMRPLLLLFALAALLLGGRKGRLVLLGALLVAGATDLTSSLTLKPIVGRIRPCAVLEDVRLPAGRCPKSASFPSSHAANSFALATYVTIHYLPLAAIAFPLALGVAVSRVYLGVHYPSDVLGGALLGTIMALVLARPLRRVGLRLFPPKASASGSAPLPDTSTLSERVHAFLSTNAPFGYCQLFYVLLAVSTLANLAIVAFGKHDLAPDEAHYWLWSKHLDWSYYSKGPAIAYIIAAATRLGGDSAFVVRLPAVLLSAATALVLFRLSRRLLASDAQAFFVTLLLRATPLFSVGGVLMTIDPPLIFCWVLALSLFWAAVREGAGVKVWIGLGVTIGVGYLAKYTMALFVPLAALCLLLSRDSRSWLRRWEPYLTGLVAAVFSLPVLVWNTRHDWITFRHVLGMAKIGTGRTGIHPLYLAEFVGNELGALSPLLAAFIVWALVRTTVRAVRDRSPLDVLLAATSVPMLLFFTALSLHSRVQANWPAPAFVTGAIAAVREAAALLATLRENRGLRLKFLRWIEASFALGLATTALAESTSLAHLLAPHFPLSLHPASRLAGWAELGREVGRIQQEMGGPEKSFLGSASYQISSELAFYVPGNPRTFNVRFGRRMDQFDFWPGLETELGKDAVYVTLGGMERPANFTPGFESCEREPTLRIVRKSQEVRSFSLFRCRGFRGFPASTRSVRY